MKITLIVALILALGYTSIMLARERIFNQTKCFCDACVAKNYPDNGNGIEYATEGK